MLLAAPVVASASTGYFHPAMLTTRFFQYSQTNVNSYSMFYDAATDSRVEVPFETFLLA